MNTLSHDEADDHGLGHRVYQDPQPDHEGRVLLLLAPSRRHAPSMRKDAGVGEGAAASTSSAIWKSQSRVRASRLQRKEREGATCDTAELRQP